MTAFSEFRDLVQRLAGPDFGRSENDLSSRLCRVFEELKLYTILDTTTGRDSRKRPDISVYVDGGTADLAGSAEVAVESKLPEEVSGNLTDALLQSPLWEGKFLPYCRAHISSLRWFCLTTFERFLFVPIDNETRAMLASGQDDATMYSAHVRSTGISLDVRSAPHDLENWIRNNLSPDALTPPPLSTVLDATAVANGRQLDEFADEMATTVAGRLGAEEPRSALIHSVRFDAERFEDLPNSAAASLMVFVLSQHPAMTPEGAREYLDAHFSDQVDDFVSASIHSLIGRLFAYKVLEDAFCIGVSPPLLPPGKYVFHRTDYDALDPVALLEAVFYRMKGLEAGTPQVIQNLAKTGAFFDWMKDRVDPQSFRRLFTLLATRSFRDLSGDLLGRFFEHYSQRIDSRRRRALGQYYTPPQIVSFMWHEALRIAQERGALDNIRVLDPGAGSAGFLTEGARRLSAAGVPEFWDRLVGFDLDPQVIGVAYVNLFLAILGSLRRSEAERVTTLRLYPTDALDPSNRSRLSPFLPLLTAEPLRDYLQSQITLSENDKREGVFDLVIGNPPYKNNSTRTLAQVAETFPRLLLTSRANAMAQTRNIRDDYAWFIAAADFYIGGRGLIAYIVSDSICAAQSYRFMRIDVLRHYRPHAVYHLGPSIFPDVGPRISFVVLFLEKRAAPLSEPHSSETLDYYDLRQLDPASRLDAIALAGTGDRSQLPQARSHLPSAEHQYALTPVGGVAQAMKRGGVPLVARAGARVFSKKWPGFITAFDGLFRAGSKDDLSRHLRDFYAAVAADPRGREAAFQRLGDTLGMDAGDQARLQDLGNQAARQGLAFEDGRLKRTLSGSSDNAERWYPSGGLTSWTYYEPRLLVPRNNNEGRERGWGSMSQWRAPESHAVSPKLVFTTASDPRRGFKAFVLRDEWYVKIHGGARQQYHYTACEDPLQPQRLGGEPNNLSVEALGLFEHFTRAGMGAEDFLLYCAGVYNSGYAFEFLSENGGDTLPIPLDRPDRALGIAGLGRRIRDLAYLRETFTSAERMNVSDTLYDVADLAAEVGFEVRTVGGGRFQPEVTLTRVARTIDTIIALIAQAQDALNTEIATLFGLGALTELD